MLFSLNQSLKKKKTRTEIKSYQHCRNGRQPLLDMMPSKQKPPVAQISDAKNFFQAYSYWRVEQKAIQETQGIRC